jgi:hypothetical protein
MTEPTRWLSSTARAIPLISGAVLALSLFCATRLCAAVPEPERCVTMPAAGAPQYSGGDRLQLVCRATYAALLDLDAKVPRWVAYTVPPDEPMCGARPRKAATAEPGPGRDNQLLQRTAHLAGTSTPQTESGYRAMQLAPDEILSGARPEQASTLVLQRPGTALLWRRLETLVQEWASSRGPLVIYAGPVLSGHAAVGGPEQSAIPSAFWKVVVDTTTGDAIGFAFAQQQGAPAEKLAAYILPIAEIEAEAAIRLPIPDGARHRKPALWQADGSRSEAARSACDPGALRRP